MCRYPRESLGSCLRHLPTAGVCDHRLGASLRLLLTAGVCEQRLGGSHRLLLTAGVCELCSSLVLGPLKIASICIQSLCAVLSLLPTTSVCASVQCKAPFPDGKATPTWRGKPSLLGPPCPDLIVKCAINLGHAPFYPKTKSQCY